MKTADTQALPAPPNLIAALIAGFDTLTTQVGLVLFPLALDLLLWLGPKLSLSGLLRRFSAGIEALLQAEVTAPLAEQAPNAAELLEYNRQIWAALGERLNLFASLRTFPVGIPSLMTARQPIVSPLGALPVIEVGSGLEAVLLWLGLSLAGLAAAALFFQLVAQAALTGKAQPLEALRRWPRAAVQAGFLTLIWIALAAAISIPGSCLVSVFALGGLGTSSIGVFLFALMLLWVFFPLFLSPHGIFVNGVGAWTSLRDSLRLTYRTYPQTSLFFLAVFVLSEGLEVLWRIPAENSWLALVGIAGHGFITTGLLAASFIYYREADRWVQRVVQQLKFSDTHRI